MTKIEDKIREPGSPVRGMSITATAPAFNKDLTSAIRAGKKPFNNQLENLASRGPHVVSAITPLSQMLHGGDVVLAPMQS